MHIAVVNHSTLVDNHGASLMTRACARQLKLHVCPQWDLAPSSLIFYYDETHIPPGSHVIAIMDDSDQQGVLGWHTEDANENIYGRVFARPSLDSGATVLTGDWSVSSVLSHEVAEMVGDPSCNLTADNGQGRMYARELSDAVEGPIYGIDVKTFGRVDSVSVANFVLPDYFDPQSTGPFDYLGFLTAPFTRLETGYVAYIEDGQWKQDAGAHLPSWRLDARSDLLSRTFRRKAV
jgi:hypothetical protein